MFEFSLGLVIGVAGLWFTSINKHRFSVYQEKLLLYRKINQRAVKLMFFPVTGNALKDIQYSLQQSELVDLTYGNSVITPEEILEKVFSFTRHELDNVDHTLKEVQDYLELVEMLRNDLGVEGLNRISHFLISPQKSKVSKSIIETINRTRTQLRNQVSELEAKQEENK